MSQSEKHTFRVMKFGGTSLLNPQRMRGVANIVLELENGVRPVVVVSAMGGVTDLLETALVEAKEGKSFDGPVEEIETRSRDAAEELVEPGAQWKVLALVDQAIADIRSLLEGVRLLGECPPRTRDAVLAWGEILSSHLVASAIRAGGLNAHPCDARDLIQTDDRFGDARVDWTVSRQKVRDGISRTAGVPVVTGFIARSEGGDTTTLGRGGSDFTASILGEMLGADRIEIWTDVDGVMSADPRFVSDAFSLSHLSYDELMELSHFGAKVVYPKAVAPARRSQTPMVIRNTMNPSFPGTTVGETASLEGHKVRGLASISPVALLRLEGSGVAGDPHIPARLFEALARKDLRTVFISQSSSERAICFAIPSSTLSVARNAIEEEFRLERQARLVDELIVEEDVSVIAVVGDGMSHTPGIAGKVFSVLGRWGINVRAVAQGSSERNISFALESGDETDALRALHGTFFGPDLLPVKLYVAGAGRVGAKLLERIRRVKDDLLETHHLNLSVVGLANSRKAVFNENGVDLSAWPEALEGADRPASDLVDEIRKQTHGIRVFVDCTASRSVPEVYQTLLEEGASLVAANKWAFSAPLEEYEPLVAASPGRNRLFYETTVGAGLPLLKTIAELRASGDEVVRVEAALSGTLSFICSRLMDGAPFSEAVAEAEVSGYTEPDPREDLTGGDVGRKAIILAREAGYMIEQDDVETAPLLPGWDPFADTKPETLVDDLRTLDDQFAQLAEAARSEGRWLSYLATLEDGHARIGLTTVAPGHPCHGLRGTDSVAAITTRWYSEPLIIRGAGAGTEVTSGGILADILKSAMETRA